MSIQFVPQSLPTIQLPTFLPLNATTKLSQTNLILHHNSWYHGSITRIEAENTLRSLSEGSFLVRNCESSRNDFSLSLK